jgi:predicted enzyme related to lactoylglutathione lyase
MDQKKRVIGLGGIFFKAKDPAAMYAWYEKHLGIKGKPGEGSIFPWRRAEDPAQESMTVWSVFPSHTKYFEPSGSSFMINYQVEDLNALLDALRAEGVTIEKHEEHEYGRFAWIIDPEGNKIELWEPAK